MPPFLEQSRLTWRDAALIAVPVVVVATVALVSAPPAVWPGLRPAQWATIASNALILEAALAVVAATLAGVARGVSWRTLAEIGVFTVASALVMLAVTGWSADSVRGVAASHAALSASVLACATLGAAARTFFRNELDAAAAALGAAVTAAFGVLTIGPTAGELPARWVNAGLAASPVVSTAAAAGIDLLRTDAFYRASPLAHQQFDYPAWYATTATYAGFALIAWSITTFRMRGSQ